MVHRVAYLVKAYNVLASLVIIKHESIGIHLVLTSGEKTWEKKGSKYIHVLGVEDKRQITIVVHVQLMEVLCLYK
jgi:hypothetical protein